MKSFYNLSAEERARVLSEFGGDDTYPAGWRPISEQEFAQSGFFTWEPDFMQYRSMRKTMSGEEAPRLSATCFFMWNNTGYAMSSDFWAGKVSYFAFGCEHDYSLSGVAEAEKRGVSLFGCNARLCSKCGHLWVVDSSD